MANYVDTKDLEFDWFSWVIAKSVPDLEIYRRTKQLWTRVPTRPGKKGLEYPDPYAIEREHCLVASIGVLKFSSTNGVIDQSIITQEGLVHNTDREATEHVKYMADVPSDYMIDRTVEDSWASLTEKVWLICSGVADYHLTSSDELYDLREDMINETAAQVFTKLRSDKLKYCPGQAPVFNLLSTAIHNLCYTFMAKESRRLANKQKLIREAWNGRFKSSVHDLSLV